MSVEELTSVLNDAMRAKSKSSTFVYGVVSSVSPIKVKVDGLPELSGGLLIVGENCREKRAYFDKHLHETPAGKSEETSGFVVVHRGLVVGDRVLMIRATDGQKYYLMERVVTA